MANIVRALPAPARRIDAAVHEAKVDAERIVAEARAEAREIVAAAAAQAEAALEDARARGSEAARAEAAELIAWAAAERDRLLATVEPEVVRLALGVAARILGRDAECSAAAARDMAARALAEARDRAMVALRLHPLDLAAVREREGELAALVPRASGIAWVADPAVGRGGAVVETETGSIDARLETQLAVVARYLGGART